jgi:YidC/Oxa1 family membrane protein insertase
LRQAGRGPILLQQVAGEQPQAQAAPQETPASTTEQLQAAASIAFGADNAPAKTVVLGSVDPQSGFEYRLELSSKGAAIRTATFSEWYDGDYKDPQPLVVISPVRQSDASEVLAMANTQFVFVEHQLQLPLDRLDWRSLDVETADANSQTARFEAVIKNKDTGEPVLKLTKTYKVSRDSYLLNCDVTIENVSRSEQKVSFNLAGPGGLGQEAYGQDVRKVIAGYRDSNGQITSMSLDKAKLHKAKTPDDRRLEVPGGKLLWVAAVNKYFAAIVVPVPDEEDKTHCDWVTDRTGRLYNPDGDRKADSGDETLGVNLKTASNTLAAEASKTYHFQLYIGPKDKSVFDKNELYRNLGFVQTIDFMGCCCPAWMINPLAFGILAIMKWMHGFWPHNYGIVIIILVFLMRLILHPVTKKSQVSMSKMSKLAPRAEEIKKKYANNKAEMNKQMMTLYREQGASPIMGMLPMMVQMPIWIALWSAVYASIDLRGAAFLPFWITDLSAPDALFRFPAFTLPLFGKLDSFNLLPILMGVAFYLQQKLMPSPAAANPQAAQQQKMMQIMLPLMFPLMLYKGPSGVNLYIMASTFAGVIEQQVIRKHIQEKEKAEEEGLVSATSKTGGKVKKKKPKPFFKM